MGAALGRGGDTQNHRVVSTGTSALLLIGELFVISSLKACPCPALEIGSNISVLIKIFRCNKTAALAGRN